MSIKLYTGDCSEVLATLPADSVNCVVTSPPYWGLRDYGVTGQLGLEATPDEYVANMVAVFREVRRVLRPDGTLWLNLGDCYATGAGKVGESPGGGEQGTAWAGRPPRGSSSTAGYRGTRPDSPKHATNTVDGKARKGIGPMTQPNRMPLPGLKPKDLVGIPWRVAFALQADGWWLRQEIIWAKPNPMPESVTDRCTKAHEHLFLLTKAAQYYCDMEAIAEPLAESSVERLTQPNLEEQAGSDRVPGKTNGPMKAVAKIPAGWATGTDRRANSNMEGNFTKQRKAAQGKSETTPRKDGERWNENEGRGFLPAATMRNKRSVWTVTTIPFTGAHFATFPPKLIEPCILAGCPEGGVVLDPFGGAGTTGLVADRHHRNAILIELNAEYAEMALARIRGESPLFAQIDHMEMEKRDDE